MLKFLSMYICLENSLVDIINYLIICFIFKKNAILIYLLIRVDVFLNQKKKKKNVLKLENGLIRLFKYF